MPAAGDPAAAAAAAATQRPLSPLAWMNRYVRKRWRGRFVVIAEELCPGEEGADATWAPARGAADPQAAPEGGGDAAAAEGAGGGAEAEPGSPTAASPAVTATGFCLDGPQDEEVNGEPRFRAHVTGMECCCELPDGRERKVDCGQAFTALGTTRRRAEQAAAALVRDWFVARGLWNPATAEGPPPPNISLVRVANRHRVQSRLRYEANPLVYMDVSLGPGGPVHRVVLELFQHTEPAGAACFLNMLQGARTSQAGEDGAAAGDAALAAPPSPLAPPPGAVEAAALRGAPFDCIIPGLLMAVGGTPEGALEIAVDPQTRAIARARQDMREEQEREAAAEARGEPRPEGGGGGEGEEGGGGGPGRGRGRGRFGRGRGPGRGGRGRGGWGRARGEGTEPGHDGGGGGEGEEGQVPQRNRYEQRFDRPFLLAVPRALVPAAASPAAASGGVPGPAADGVGEAGAGAAAPGAAPPAAVPDAPTAAAPAAPGPPPAPPPPPPLAFFVSLGPSRELQERHLAVGHVLAGFGALRQAALAAQDAAEGRARGGAASAADPAATAPTPPACSIAACARLPEGSPPPGVEPLMLGRWPAWPEDLAPPERPDMEAEAQARLAAALGIKAAGNEAHAAGDLARAVAHYRQGIRYLELISFRSDLMGASCQTISYDTSLPMWEAEVALRLNLCASLTALGRGAQAAEVLRELRHKIPSNPKMWYRLGHALASQGASKLPEALDAFQKAAALAPADKAVRAALEAARSSIARAQAETRGTIGRGLARAFEGPLLYSDDGEEHIEEWGEDQEEDVEAARGVAAPAGPEEPSAPDAAGAGAGAGGAGGRARCAPPPPRVPEELAAELIGRHLGLHTLGAAARAPALDPAAQLMAAWFQPRA